MKLKLKDKVILKQFQKEGAIIQILPNDYYIVLYGNISIKCHVSQLEISNNIKRPSSSFHKECIGVTFVKRAKTPTKLDLHGYFVEEAIRLLEDTINDCIMAGGHELEIIHGIGTGKVKTAVLKYLKTSPLIRNYKEVMGNPGTTRAFF